jgi:2-polyprenyl-6-methoxyphenol hydroxylase-like FAD-dependent oxidoreductase
VFHSLPFVLKYHSGLTDAQSKDTPQFWMIRAERSKLRDWLLTKIPVAWGEHVTHIEQGDKGTEAFFADGSSVKGDIAIGADGANSLGTSVIEICVVRYECS